MHPCWIKLFLSLKKQYWPLTFEWYCTGQAKWMITCNMKSFSSSTSHTQRTVSWLPVVEATELQLRGEAMTSKSAPISSSLHPQLSEDQSEMLSSSGNIQQKITWVMRGKKIRYKEIKIHHHSENNASIPHCIVGKYMPIFFTWCGFSHLFLFLQLYSQEVSSLFFF